jgi:uncharacterized protein (TIGR02588 family)
MPSNGTRKKIDTQEFRKNKLEWSVFAISALLLFGLIVYLCYEAFTHKPAPPDLEVKYLKDSSNRNPFAYKIHLQNHGEETAEDVMIEASLIRNDTVIEHSELQIAFSPKRSKREGWINFSTDPAEADSINIKVMSYKKP